MNKKATTKLWNNKCQYSRNYGLFIQVHACYSVKYNVLMVQSQSSWSELRRTRNSISVGGYSSHYQVYTVDSRYDTVFTTICESNVKH